MLIYKITNLINKKSYVGQLCNNLKFKYYWGSGTYIKRTIKKYGKENFSKMILEELTCIDKKQLDRREQFWIKKLNTRIPNGYNLTDGGEGTFGYSHTEETKKKIRLALVPSKEDIEKWSKRTSGKNNPMFGRKHTAETKIKMSINNAMRNPEIAKKSIETRRKRYWAKIAG